MDLLGGGGGGAGGVIFHDKTKNIRDKMRYNNLSNKMMISELFYNSNTVVKQEFAVAKQVDGRTAHMTDTTRHQQGWSLWEVCVCGV